MATHLTHLGANGVQFTAFHPAATYEVGREVLSFHGDDSFGPTTEQAAIDFLASKLGVSKDTLQVTSGYSSDTATHVYITQKLNGVMVANGVANVVFNKAGTIVGYGANVMKPKEVSSSDPEIEESAAIAAAETALGATYNNWPVKTEYVLQDSNEARLAYVVQVRNKQSWFEASVDTQSGKVINVIDFVAHAAYRVVPWNQQDPTEGPFKLVQDPADKTSSPKGWHQDSKTAWNTTRGNNVIAYKEDYSATSTQSADNLVFDYAWNASSPPDEGANLDAARTNAFYITNSYHDLLYKYGFTEKAFNFQDDNFGKGGVGGDPVEMSVQEQDGTDNANFATPPDGQMGHCNMYLWDITDPERDGDLSNDVITHEFTHGLTNRMTGGGTGRCLNTLESGGMGEGWSDTLSFWTEQTSTTPADFTLGAWVDNSPAGIRSVPYSTNKKVDPYTYGTVATKDEVHDIGEVWSTVLVEVYWALVGKFGFSAEFFNPDQTQGNIVFLHLLVDALPLQPCAPTFLTARDAIILADSNRYKGANKCLLWQAFARRGLGPKAAKYKDDTSVPAGC